MAFRDAVRFHKPESKLRCHRLNAFRAFQQSSAAEMSTPTLGATICDKDKPYFFSRLWHEKKYNPNAIAFDFPLLFLFEIEATARYTSISEGLIVVSHHLQVGVVDVYTEPKPSASYCHGCEGRTVNEIYQDTERLLYYALRFVSDLGVETTSDLRKRMVHRSACQDPERWEELNMFSDTTSEPILRIERPAERIYGTATFIRAVARHCIKNIDAAFTDKDFGVISHEAGCSDCS